MLKRKELATKSRMWRREVDGRREQYYKSSFAASDRTVNYDKNDRMCHLEHSMSWHHHRFLLLKLDKQIGRWHHLMAHCCNKRGKAAGGWDAVHMPPLMQTSTTRWLCGCVSSLNNRRLWYHLKWCTFGL